jgi:hypothetical protein
VTLSGLKVTLNDPIIICEIEKTFATYEDAIKCFDDTCNKAAQIHKAARPLPAHPNFTSTINI